MMSATDYMLADLWELVLLGSLFLSLPAAVLAAGSGLLLSRRRGPSLKRALLLSLGAAVLVGGGFMLGLWIINGTMDDAPMLGTILAGGIIVALLGAAPAGLIAHALGKRALPRIAADPAQADAEAV